VDLCTLQFLLSFLHGVPRIAGVFFCAPIVSNPADDFFRIVTAGQGSPRVGPVMLGLADLSRPGRGYGPWLVARPEIVLDWFGTEAEILEVMEAVGVLLRLHTKLDVVFAVEKARETEHTRRVGGRRVASKFVSHEGISLTRGRLLRENGKFALRTRCEQYVGAREERLETLSRLLARRLSK
jgi:hypothetical protein